jgi:hypothetical protein
MAITEAYSGSATITTTEYSAPSNANFVSGTGITANPGVYQVFLDVSDMVVGDQLQIRIYEAVRSVAPGNTQRTIYESILAGAQADAWVSPSLILLHNWDVTLDTLAGTTIVVNWSIRKVA